MVESLNLEDHIPVNHLLCSIDRCLDLSDLRHYLTDFYSPIGRPSIAPELMIRMLIVGYCDGIRSERLCEETHLKLAYRWFCRSVRPGSEFILAGDDGTTGKDSATPGKNGINGLDGQRAQCSWVDWGDAGGGGEPGTHGLPGKILMVSVTTFEGGIAFDARGGAGGHGGKGARRIAA